MPPEASNVISSVSDADKIITYGKTKHRDKTIIKTMFTT